MPPECPTAPRRVVSAGTLSLGLVLLQVGGAWAAAPSVPRGVAQALERLRSRSRPAFEALRLPVQEEVSLGRGASTADLGSATSASPRGDSASLRGDLVMIAGSLRIPVVAEQLRKIVKHGNHELIGTIAPDLLRLAPDGSGLSIFLDLIEDLGWTTFDAVVVYLHEMGVAKFCGPLRACLERLERRQDMYWGFPPEAVARDLFKALARDCPRTSVVGALKEIVLDGGGPLSSWAGSRLSELLPAEVQVMALALEFMASDNPRARAEGLQLCSLRELTKLKERILELLDDPGVYLATSGCVGWKTTVSKRARQTVKKLFPNHPLPGETPACR